jgi:hypothetical protein
MGLLSHEIPAAHEVVKGDPRIDGPYLDDHNAAYEDARRQGRLAAQQEPKDEDLEPEDLETEDLEPEDDSSGNDNDE